MNSLFTDVHSMKRVRSAPLHSPHERLVGVSVRGEAVRVDRPREGRLPRRCAARDAKACTHLRKWVVSCIPTCCVTSTDSKPIVCCRKPIQSRPAASNPPPRPNHPRGAARPAASASSSPMSPHDITACIHAVYTRSTLREPPGVRSWGGFAQRKQSSLAARHAALASPELLGAWVSCVDLQHKFPRHDPLSPERSLCRHSSTV